MEDGVGNHCSHEATPATDVTVTTERKSLHKVNERLRAFINRQESSSRDKTSLPLQSLKANKKSSINEEEEHLASSILQIDQRLNALVY
jgi:hypothetical protein